MKSQKTIQIADTIHGSIKLNSIEKQVISTQIFNRLHNIYQNSTVYLTFPTNRTKRFEHSIGTMWLCGRIFKQGISNSDNETVGKLFMEIQEEIDNEIRNKLSNYESKYRQKIGDSNLRAEKLIDIYKKIGVFEEYNDVIPMNVQKEYLSTYMIIYQSIRLCGLLHDVGHPPFSHITEFALKNIWEKVYHKEKRTTRQENFISCMEPYFRTDQDLHEQIGNRITAKVLDDIIGTIAEEEANKPEVKNKQMFKILVTEITSAILEEKRPIFGQLHRIVDGTLDGDRLDYVSRDPINSGINAGIIEYDRIIENIRLIHYNDSFMFASSSKAVDTIDDFFNRRWRMYKQIIYHHRVIKTDFLLQDCIETLAMSYLASDEKECESGDVLPYDISGIWKAIKSQNSYTSFFNTLVQWDDCWLLTVLKAHYFGSYVEETEKTDMNLKNKLEELLANKKKYYSLIKRMEDFITIDIAIEKEMKEQYNNILCEELKKFSLNSSMEVNASPDVVKEEDSIEIGHILKPVNDLFKQLDKCNRVEHQIPENGFVLPKVKKIFGNIFEDNWLNEIVYKGTQELVTSNAEIEDMIPVIKKLKTGIPGSKVYDEPGGLGLYTFEKDGQIKVYDYSDISNLNNILLEDVNYMPVFYVYILKNTELDYQCIKEKLGKSIGSKIMDKIEKKLNELACVN